MPNHLTHENSPYLLQHAHNPVAWYPWGPEALQKAQAENKPIFLSIGYAACHWCHVMAHESFEDADTAALMNEYFVNIKVDREERPDLDGIYMQAVVALTGSGGWPMSVFLTPEGIPFLGGTYFPPVRRYNMPGFRELLLAVAHAWQNDHQRMLDNGQQLLEHIRSQNISAELTSLKLETLDNAATSLAKDYDWKYGGWGKAPKFPQPMAIEFLLRKAMRGDAFARDIAAQALKSMAKGGMYDVVGGGFARYSTDDEWLTPHFEKMLYDNAQLALAYLHGWLLTGERQFRQICEETLDFVSRELTHPQGGFYSSLDADSEGQEGKFYIWTPAEIRAALPAEQHEFVFAAYPVSEGGNFEGSNVLQRQADDATLAKQFAITPGEVTARLKEVHAQLLAARAQRVRPATDDKILTSWNALMLSAFAEAARYLKSDAYLKVAIRSAEFLLNSLFHAGHLQRSWRDGSARHNAYLEDYAALSLALLSLYQSDPNPRWFQAAQNLAGGIIIHFTDSSGGFYDTRDDHEALITRPKDLQDNATPCGSSLAAMALLQLAAYTGEKSYRNLAEASIGSILPAAERYPTAFANWLCASDFALGPVQEVAIIGDFTTQAGRALVNALWATYRPRLVAALVSDATEAETLPLTAGRTAIQGQPTAYVCQNFTCQLPVHLPAQLTTQLNP